MAPFVCLPDTSSSEAQSSKQSSHMKQILQHLLQQDKTDNPNINNKTL